MLVNSVNIASLPLQPLIHNLSLLLSTWPWLQQQEYETEHSDWLTSCDGDTCIDAGGGASAEKVETSTKLPSLSAPQLQIP